MQCSGQKLIPKGLAEIRKPVTNERQPVLILGHVNATALILPSVCWQHLFNVFDVAGCAYA